MNQVCPKKQCLELGGYIGDLACVFRAGLTFDVKYRAYQPVMNVPCLFHH
jgi:hypothetical protein